MRIVERKEVGAALEAFCDKYETYKEAAKKLGITLSQLSAARRKPKSVVPAKALKKLGFEFKPVYLSKEMPPAPAKAQPKRVRKEKPAVTRLRADHPRKAKKLIVDLSAGMALPVENYPAPVVVVTNQATPVDPPHVEGIANRNAVDDSVIENVVDVEPDNPDIYDPDREDSDDTITIN